MRALCVVAMSALLVSFAMPSWALVNKCPTAKIKATGTKAGSKTVCYAKGVSAGSGVDSSCLAKAEIKFSTAFAKAEAKAADCVNTGDTSSIEGKVDNL